VSFIDRVNAYGRRGRRGSAPPVPAAAPPDGPGTPQGPAAGATGSSASGDNRSQLRRRRDALAGQVTELHWDLGGLAYEMAIRDHFRLDVLVGRAAVLQEREAELCEVERLLRLEDGAIAGGCPRCGAPHSRGAVYCWQCGARLMQVAAPAGAGSDGAATAQTAVMDALLAPSARPASSSPPEGGQAG
jgi:hypothetical protein